MRDINGHSRVEQQQKISHAHIDTRPGKSRVEGAELDASGRESASGCDVSSTTESQIADDGLRVDLRGKDLEDRRQR